MHNNTLKMKNYYNFNETDEISYKYHDDSFTHKSQEGQQFHMHPCEFN